MIVVLPAPVWPTNATVSPGSMVNDTSRSTQSNSSSSADACCCGLELLAFAGSFFGGLRHGAIGEPYVVELDASRAVRSLRNLRRNNFRLCVEQLKDALARRHRRLQNVVLLAQVLNGTEEALSILHEGHQHAERHRIANDLVPAKPDDARNRRGRKNFDHRVVNRVRLDCVLVRIHVRAVDFFKLLVRPLLAVEELQDDDSGHVLLQGTR